MLKLLLSILVIVSLMAFVLNFNFFDEPISIQEPMPKIIKNKIIEPIKKEIIIPAPLISKKNLIKNNLNKELKALLIQAQSLFNQNQDLEALVIYEQIIEKSKNSQETEILKLFAEACFKKATIHYIYPSYDTDAALESYELITQKFENSEEKSLLLLYMKAKVQQAPFSSREEILATYDELIEKFTNDKEERFSTEIEELLFAKSLSLMGVDDEEAIEVLDRIISKYDNTTKLPDTVRFSILNNIELSIITANETEKYVDLAQEYMSDSPDTKPLLDMLDIIKNAQNLDQSEAFSQWQEEHSNYAFQDWDFSELRKWANNMEVLETQIRIHEYLDAFEKQKFNNINQSIIYTTPKEAKDTQSNQDYEEKTTAYPNPYAHNKQ
ncbi:MAG: Unknown protein [uncultured Sulfurovum sp.]|uniref:Uncharacterized protein n=1 Tax=uncultured Sulfurovum sp. TaxID=269237 RepID=A0A6S6TEH8_9BACT|nr:MAG: Unknown protein [uncultured Sulfurovum sp.]